MSFFYVRSPEGLRATKHRRFGRGVMKARRTCGVTWRSKSSFAVLPANTRRSSYHLRRRHRPSSVEPRSPRAVVGAPEPALQGRAEFTVTHDPARPFRVRTDVGQAEDLGTRFV